MWVGYQSEDFKLTAATMGCGTSIARVEPSNTRSPESSFKEITPRPKATQDVSLQKEARRSGAASREPQRGAAAVKSAALRPNDSFEEEQPPQHRNSKKGSAEGGKVANGGGGLMERMFYESHEGMLPKEDMDAAWASPDTVNDEEVKEFLARVKAEGLEFVQQSNPVQGLRIIRPPSQSSSDSSDEASSLGNGTELTAEDWLDGDEEEAEEDGGAEKEEQTQLTQKTLRASFTKPDPVLEKEAWRELGPVRAALDDAGITIANQIKFFEALEPISYKAEEYIVRQGEVGDRFYVLTRGHVRLTKTLPTGEEEVLTHLYAGHFFGEMSLFNNEARVANIIAEVDAECMCMSKEKFAPFLEQDAKFRDMIQALVKQREQVGKERAERSKKREVVRREGKPKDVRISRLEFWGRTKEDKKQVINKYLVLHKLGKGAFGVVYRAVHLPTGRQVAMKRINRAKMRKLRIGKKSDEDVVKEIAIMKRLNHRNVVSLLEVIDDPQGDYFFLVQEYVKNGAVMHEQVGRRRAPFAPPPQSCSTCSLPPTMCGCCCGSQEENQPLPSTLARKYFRDILAGMDYLHFQGVIHRDIKPGNILVADDVSVSCPRCCCCASLQAPFCLPFAAAACAARACAKSRTLAFPPLFAMMMTC